MKHPPEIHQYQLNAVRFGLQKQASYQMIDAGMGKTLIALTFLNHLSRPSFVFAPVKVCYNVWPDEIKKWYPNLSYTIFHGAKKDQKLRLAKDIYIIPYSSIPWFYDRCCTKRFPIKKYPVVFDEATMLKESSTKRFKLTKKLLALCSKYRMNLSATPMPIGFHNLWAQYYALDYGRRLGRYYSHFRDLHFNYTGPPYFRTTLKSATEKQIIFNKIKDITYRLAVDDYLKMPKLMNRMHKIKLPSKVLKLYEQLAADACLQLDSGGVTAFSDIALKGKLRQMMQGAIYNDIRRGEKMRSYSVLHTLKIDFLKSMVEELQGDPLLVAINFRFELEMIRKALGPVPAIVGGVSEKKARGYVQAWNAGRLPVLLCHPLSMAHGLNLQKVGRRILWMALPWSLELYIQMIRRLWRQGQGKPVMVHHLVIENSVDEDVLPVLQKRDTNQNDLFNAVKRGLRR